MFFVAMIFLLFCVIVNLGDILSIVTTLCGRMSLIVFFCNESVKVTGPVRFLIELLLGFSFIWPLLILYFMKGRIFVLFFGSGFHLPFW